MKKSLMILTLACLGGLWSFHTIGQSVTGEEEDYRAVIWGNNGAIPWKDLLPEKGLDGLNLDQNWKRDGNILTGSKKEGSTFLKYGSPDWKNYEIDFRVSIQDGGITDIGFRLTGMQAYVFKLNLGGQVCAVVLRDFSGKQPMQQLSVVNYKLKKQQEYHIQIAVRGASITTYVDGQLVNQLTDKTLAAGGFYFEVWKSTVSYRNIRYRQLE